MSTEKKPVATVKANFNSKTAAKTPEKTAAPVKEAKGKTEDHKGKVEKEEKKVEKKVEKKAAPVKAEEKKAAPAKAAEKKAAPVKKETVAAKKPVEKKAAPAKTEEKAAPVKAEEKKVEKKAEKKAAPAKATAEVILQWNGNDYTYERLLQSAKDVWQYDQGKNVNDFKSAQIYVKPEEGKAYVVVNGTDELSFDI